MKELLPLLPRPSQYLGIEEGALHRICTPNDIHCVLAFPDMYTVGMSYLGHKILYSILNAAPNILAERVFTPALEAAVIMREHETPLATLETDTPLANTHCIGFSITHELCYTNVLYMLDLAGIPFRAVDRGDTLDAYPLIIAGGGCTLSAEPLTPFMDAMLLGEGEEVLLEFVKALHEARKAGISKTAFLRKVASIHGVYIPSLFTQDASTGALKPLDDTVKKPLRRIVPSLDDAPYPIEQIVPFGAVHNRLALEIARGCTRGCRFCQAGILYRPARERSLLPVQEILEDCLAKTGFDELSFLSLSTGDFSALKTLFLDTSERCASEQISLSLPSLRVGSIDNEIMARIAGIRRTGATLAPEAGSQRLRDIINKGVTEEALLTHVRSLIDHGWQQVKLYFMIGLPHETQEDLDAIVDLARKVRDVARQTNPSAQRLQVTVAISPFVPKPHTPFQWDAQLTLDEMTERIAALRTAFKQEKNIKMRWHEPAVSHLEGLLSRGDRSLAPVLEEAYKRGAVFASWMEHFALSPWLEAFEACGIDPLQYTRERSIDEILPWDHLESGVDRDFLLRERARAEQGLLTSDCRYDVCHTCGVCDLPKTPSRLHTEATPKIANSLNYATRDQAELIQTDIVSIPKPDTEKANPAKKASPTKLSDDLIARALRFRVWHHKKGLAAYFSQLELQSLLERALRRAGIPMAFSQGFHPMPLISFGRALPVSVESHAEWFSVTLRRPMLQEAFVQALAPRLLEGLELTHVELIPIHQKSLGSLSEAFGLRYSGEDTATVAKAFAKFASSTSFVHTRESKKGDRTTDLRPLFQHLEAKATNEWDISFDWSSVYISPLTLIKAIVPDAPLHQLHLVKRTQTLVE